MKNRITIIVPVYQVAEYLPKCLDSIMAQTYANLEIILVDDGSDDGSGDICDKYAGADSRIKVIHKENGGLVSARKAAMRIAEGDLIANIDSDDWVDADMFEKMYACMEETDADVVVTGHTENFSEKEVEWKNAIPAGTYRGEALKNEVFAKMLYNPDTLRWSLSPACWDKLFKREIVERFQMKVDERIWDGEDHAFTYPAILTANTVTIMDETPYHHRIRMDSVSQAFDDKAFERLGYLYEGLRRAYISSGYWDVLEKPSAYQMRWFLLKHMHTELGIDEYENAEAVRPYIFPFDKIDPGSKVILYGAGKVGQLFYRQIETTHYCEIVLWVSKDAEQHEAVSEIREMVGTQFDKIVVAVESGKIAEEIKKDLLSMGIDAGRIVWRNPRMERMNEI